MGEKISTSIQYQYTNVKLFHEIFGNWKEFYNYLNSGPQVMKEYFETQWNDLKEKLKNNENLLIKDIDKVVTKDDFDITLNRTKNGTNIFYFKFPDYEYRDAASKYVALVLAPDAPRFITLEYSEEYLSKELCFFIGEFFINKETKKIEHRNYGKAENDRISWFAGFVLGLMESQGL